MNFTVIRIRRKNVGAGKMIRILRNPDHTTVFNPTTMAQRILFILYCLYLLVINIYKSNHVLLIVPSQLQIVSKTVATVHNEIYIWYNSESYFLFSQFCIVQLYSSTLK